MTDRKKPGVAFWATMVVVVVLVAYPLSFGPACWISSRVQPSGRVVSVIYSPVIWTWHRSSPWAHSAIAQYVGMGIATNKMVIYGGGWPTIEFE
jgi:hypothetical protein